MILIPNKIAEDSWLREPEYTWFVAAYNYACTQNRAIPALSQSKPEDLYFLFMNLMRGSTNSGHDLKEILKNG